MQEADLELQAVTSDKVPGMFTGEVTHKTSHKAGCKGLDKSLSQERACAAPRLSSARH